MDVSLPPDERTARPPSLLGRAVAAIDRVNELVGRGVAWLTLVMVLVGSWNAVGRWIGREVGLSLASNAYLELQWYLFSLVFLLGASYTLRHGRHVRVDVLYSRLGRRGRATINLAGTVLFLVPFSLAMLWLSWPSVAASWAVREVSPDPGGLPRYPLKAVILVAFALLLLQGLAEAVRYVAILRGRAEEEPAERGEAAL